MTAATFGSPTPQRFGQSPSAPTFPQTAQSWTSSDGAIVVPGGALEGWWKYRATLGAVRGDVICIGDSTLYGSGGLYSICQRLRDNASGASTGGPTGFGMADGGKGVIAGGESLIGYDAPEINGFVSTTFSGTGDSQDLLDGQFYYDSGHANAQLVLQFRQTAIRLWYSDRVACGDFTYSVDGGATQTVKSYQTGDRDRFVYVSGLAPNTTHTITITNLATSSTGGGPALYIALDPINATGIVFQKSATSGDLINLRFYAGAGAPPYTQSLNSRKPQPSFGLARTLVSQPSYRGATIDTSEPAAGRINPVLAFTMLGFNDLTNVTGSSDLPMWTEYVKRFAGCCQDAGCPGIIATGQLPYNANWPTYGAARWNNLKNQAIASGLAFVDLFYPIGGPSLSYAGGATDPHLTKAQYQSQADYLWNGLLGLLR